VNIKRVMEDDTEEVIKRDGKKDIKKAIAENMIIKADIKVIKLTVIKVINRIISRMIIKAPMILGQPRTWIMK
jgi:hypothetical protein